MVEEGPPNPPFIKGLKLAFLFYREAIKPLLDQHFPDLAHSAGRLDQGSEVLGFDTPRSTDHHWGPRVQLFLSHQDFNTYHDDVDEMLRQELPYEIHGYPTHFSPQDIDGGCMMPVSDGPVNHAVMLQTVESFFQSYVNISPDQEIRVIDWLTMPEQCLSTISSGTVFYDGLGTVEAVRARLRYYPWELWLYLLASQWRRISQEEAFVGRTAHVADEIGSRIIAARLVRDIMKLCFLMERTYAPYIKWFGTSFKQLPCAPEVEPVLRRITSAESYYVREAALSEAYTIVARMHNALQITGPMQEEVSKFHDRPYVVIQADEFSEAIRDCITSDEVKALPPHIGAIDQLIDSTDLLTNINHCKHIESLYG